MSDRSANVGQEDKCRTGARMSDRSANIGQEDKCRTGGQMSDRSANVGQDRSLRGRLNLLYFPLLSDIWLLPSDIRAPVRHLPSDV